uniref:Predicted protein n=1 Tax=Hordeum vulgare subsp. vulgare TaxID=112509 RepID=F2DF76_HORVV|nr:predicted protein [Hordeum vulgare subsp. vulgare]
MILRLSLIGSNLAANNLEISIFHPIGREKI